MPRARRLCPVMYAYGSNNCLCVPLDPVPEAAEADE